MRGRPKGTPERKRAGGRSRSAGVHSKQVKSRDIAEFNQWPRKSERKAAKCATSVGLRLRTSVSPGQRMLTVHVPLTLHKRGGRKLVVSPDGVVSLPRRTHFDNPFVKALARAFRWQKLLENGTFANIAEIARAEQINDSYVSRLLRLTLLAPDIVEAILDGRQVAGLQIEALLRPMPVEWERQRQQMASAG